MGGKSKVIGKLLRMDPPEIGIADEDPGRYHPRSLERFSLVGERADVKLMTRDERRRILICSYFEARLHQSAREYGVSSEDFGIPNDPIHDVEFMGRQEDVLISFLESLRRDEGMAALRDWLR